MESVKDIAANYPTLTYCLAGASTAVGLYAGWRFYNGKPLYQAFLTKRSHNGEVYPADTVVLQQVPRGTRAPSRSPFPLKLETYLRLAQIPYQNAFSFKMSSKGKTPWMSYNGEEIADSELCIRYLNDKLGVDLDRGLTLEQKAVARAIQVLVNEHLQWTLVYFRFHHDKEQVVNREYFQYHSIPFWPVNKFIQRSTAKDLHNQGMGRHSKEEIEYFLITDLNALNSFLGEKAFMMGDEMTEVDCSVFGTLCQFIFHQEDQVLGGLVQGTFPKLFHYVLRIKRLLWPDWDNVLAKDGMNKIS